MSETQSPQKKPRELVGLISLIFIAFLFYCGWQNKKEDAKTRTTKAGAINEIRAERPPTPLYEKLARTNILGRYGPIRASIGVLRYGNISVTNN